MHSEQPGTSLSGRQAGPFPRWLCRGRCLGVLAVALGAVPVALACSTPVNRYALYRWEPSPYRIFVLYRGEEPRREGAHARLLAEQERDGQLANFIYAPLNLDASEALSELPPTLRARCAELESDELPQYLVVSPRGVEVFLGALEAVDVGGILDSPARQGLARLIHEGHDGVLMLLTGDDAEATEKARQAAREAVRLAAGEGDGSAGGSSLRVVPGDDPATRDVGYLEVDHTSAAERWFVSMLLGVEKLEPGDRGLPMVFAAYGRGRAMEPYIGAGIEARNLRGVIDFINGPCSCQVKDENPGADLLVAWNWEETARKVANEMGQETGNEHLVGERLLWDLSALSPAYVEGEATTVVESAVESEDEGEAERAAESLPSPAGAVAPQTDMAAAAETTASLEATAPDGVAAAATSAAADEAAPREPAGGARAPASAEVPAAGSQTAELARRTPPVSPSKVEEGAPESGDYRNAVLIVGLGVAAVLLVLGTLFVLRARARISS